MPQAILASERQPLYSTSALPQDMMTESDVILSCRNVWKVYGGSSGASDAILPDAASTAEKRARLGEAGAFCAVSDISLDVRRGEILMVMGLSGSGKSTLLRCLSRLVEPTSGTITIGGIDLLGANPSQLVQIRRDMIGMVFQNFGLLPHLTVLDNVAFPLRVQGVAKKLRYQRGRELLDLVQLSERADHYPHQLSGGQQQRVGIARSLAGGPVLWFLDEPFSALDPLIRRQMQDEFLRLQSHLGKTIVFVTHDFAEAARLGDRIAIMRDGQLVQLGSAAEILLAPADDYVRSFTAEVSLLQTVTARSVMPMARPASASDRSLPRLQDNTRLEEMLPHFINGAAAIAVCNGENTILGVIDRECFNDLLVRAKIAAA